MDAETMKSNIMDMTAKCGTLAREPGAEAMLADVRQQRRIMSEQLIEEHQIFWDLEEGKSKFWAMAEADEKRVLRQRIRRFTAQIGHTKKFIISRVVSTYDEGAEIPAIFDGYGVFVMDIEEFPEDVKGDITYSLNYLQEIREKRIELARDLKEKHNITWGLTPDGVSTFLEADEITGAEESEIQAESEDAPGLGDISIDVEDDDDWDEESE